MPALTVMQRQILAAVDPDTRRSSRLIRELAGLPATAAALGRVCDALASLVAAGLVHVERRPGAPVTYVRTTTEESR